MADKFELESLFGGCTFICKADLANQNASINRKQFALKYLNFLINNPDIHIKVSDKLEKIGVDEICGAIIDEENDKIVLKLQISKTDGTAENAKLFLD